MKKIIFAITGLFMLSSCSDELIYEPDQHSDNASVGTNTYDPWAGYESPYETANAGNPIDYVFVNQTTLEMVVTAYVGLAYYDGADDFDYHHTPLLPFPIDLNNGNYPELVNNGYEYGSLMPTNTVILDGLGGVTIFGESTSHCPTLNMLGLGSVNDEAVLLQDFGKVYFYNVSFTGSTLFWGSIQLDPGTIATSPDWTLLPQPANVFNADMYVHNTTNEIVPIAPSGPNMYHGEASFIGPGPLGTPVLHYLRMTGNASELRLELTY